MVDASVAQRLVDEMIYNLPRHDPGQRPVHTIGIGVDAYFTASDVARKYCIAEHFSGAAHLREGEIFQRVRGVRSSMMDGPMSGEWRHASSCRAGRQPT